MIWNRITFSFIEIRKEIQVGEIEQKEVHDRKGIWNENLQDLSSSCFPLKTHIRYGMRESSIN